MCKDAANSCSCCSLPAKEALLSQGQTGRGFVINNFRETTNRCLSPLHSVQCTTTLQFLQGEAIAAISLSTACAIKLNFSAETAAVQSKVFVTVDPKFLETKPTDVANSRFVSRPKQYSSFTLDNTTPCLSWTNKEPQNLDLQVHCRSLESITQTHTSKVREETFTETNNSPVFRHREEMTVERRCTRSRRKS